MPFLLHRFPIVGCVDVTERVQDGVDGSDLGGRDVAHANVREEGDDAPLPGLNGGLYRREAGTAVGGVERFDESSPLSLRDIPPALRGRLRRGRGMTQHHYVVSFSPLRESPQQAGIEKGHIAADDEGEFV